MKHRITELENGSYIFQQFSEFKFQNGGSIPELTLAYETHGQINSKGDNIIVIHHALSASHHVCSSDRNRAAGWWEGMVGLEKPINTNRYFVICINNLGSCFGSSSPAMLNPQTGRYYQMDFPLYTFYDIVESQKILFDVLGIQHVKAIIGSSVGAMVSKQFATSYPQFADSIISISSTYKAYPSNIANRAIQREAIMLDPAWNRGYYHKNPLNGLKIARKLGFFTYRGVAEFDERFESHKNDEIPTDISHKISDIEDYLEYNANKFVENFDANSYLYLLKAMDLYDITRFRRNYHWSMDDIKSKMIVISIDSDKLFTPNQQIDLYKLFKKHHLNTKLYQLKSKFGHDSFLIEIDRIGSLIMKEIEADD